MKKPKEKKAKRPATTTQGPKKPTPTPKSELVSTGLAIKSTKPDLAMLIAAFNKRKAENAKKEKIDNSRLPAGSPMYFYCRYCGGLSDTLPEDYNPQVNKPSQVCPLCRIILEHGIEPPV